MTPCERARQIDKEEFAAECAAVRQRVEAYMKDREYRKRCEIEQWLRRDVPRTIPVRTPARKRSEPTPRKPKNNQKHEFNGISLSLRGWAEELSINVNALYQRIHKLGSLEAVLMKHFDLQAGVVANVSKDLGTGGGSDARETAEISFSKKASDT